MPRIPLVGGNWKSNPKTWADAEKLLEEFSGKGAALDKSACELVLFPIALHASKVQEKLKALGGPLGATAEVGVQNVSKEAEGAFTAEMTVGQIKDVGLPWVLVGHSERRHKYAETDADMCKKVAKAQEAGLNCIFCIGELLEERKAGTTNEVVKKQILEILPAMKDWDKLVIAYEPVWAIGTGEVATTEQAQDAHLACREVLKSSVSAEVAEKVRILYGGSVTPDNCGDLIKCDDVDGFLVGGASLKPGLMDICSSVVSYVKG